MSRSFDTRPQHERIAAEIRARILDGWLAPGEQLATVTRLKDEFGSTSATIQRSLDLLKDEGLLRSRPGAGVYVREDSPFVITAAAYITPGADGISYQLIEVGETTPPPDVAGILGTRAVQRTRLMLAGDEPIELSTSFYPIAIAAGTPLAHKRRIPGGAPQLLAELGHPLAGNMVDQITVRPPTSAEVDILHLPRGVPVIRQLRTLRSTAGSVAEVTMMIKPGNRCQLEYAHRGPDIEGTARR